MRMPRVPRIPTARARRGRHTAAAVPAPRRVRPPEFDRSRYRGTHRAGPGFKPPTSPVAPRSLPAEGKAKAPVPPARRPARTGQRLTPLSDRPNTMIAGPRGRFAAADTTAARVDYERRQRDELRAQRAAAGGKADARITGGKRQTMGQRQPARARFTAPTSDQLNRTARALTPPYKARGTARRPTAELRNPHAVPGQPRGRHAGALPEPQTSGRGQHASGRAFAGEGFAARFFGQPASSGTSGRPAT